MVLFFAVFAISLLAIVLSSKWVVESAVRIAEAFKLSKIAVGVILLAVVASLPEVMIAIFSSIRDEATLSVGNVFGASLIDMTLVIGLMVLYAGAITITKKEVLKMLQFLFVASLVPLFVLLRGGISLGFGVLLLGFFALYIRYLYKRERAEVKEAAVEAEATYIEPSKISTKEKLFLAGKFIASLFVLIYAADFMVGAAIDIAAFFAVGATLIGATVVAFGTALPEMSISIRAAKKGEQSLALADVFGASITDLTLVLGTVSLLSGLLGGGKILIGELAGVTTALPFLVISVLTIWYLLSVYGKIEVIQGLTLLALYMGFVMQITGSTILFSVAGLA